jgi:hypothetical protein
MMHFVIKRYLELAASTDLQAKIGKTQNSMQQKFMIQDGCKSWP